MTLTASDLITLVPLEILAATIIAVMLVTLFRRSQTVAMVLSVAGLTAAAASVAVVAGRAPRNVAELLLFDDYALLFLVLICVATIVVAGLSYAYMRRGEPHPIDLYTLLLMAAFGGVTLSASIHFASFFLGLEVLSVALYVLIAYPRIQDTAVEAGVKYLILAAATAATLLFGMALVYAAAGSMDLRTLGGLATRSGAGGEIMFAAGIALMLVGIGYKLALVPFHMWTPDIYQGAPVPVTAFVSTVSKAAVAALLLRLVVGGQTLPAVVTTLIVVLAFASMIVGNLLALRQDDVKRILAYSSIAQLGYLMVPFVAGGRTAVVAAVYFLVAYVLTMLAAFGVVSALSEAGREASAMAAYEGLGERHPWLAGGFTLALLSLAGIPMTAGFIGKFYLVNTGAEASRWALLIVLVVMSAVSLFYYTRIIVAMYVHRPAPAAARDENLPPGVGAPRVSGALVGLMVAGFLFLGVYPGPLVEVLNRVSGDFKTASAAVVTPMSSLGQASGAFPKSVKAAAPGGGPPADPSPAALVDTSPSLSAVASSPSAALVLRSRPLPASLWCGSRPPLGGLRGADSRSVGLGRPQAAADNGRGATAASLQRTTTGSGSEVRVVPRRARDAAIFMVGTGPAWPDGLTRSAVSGVSLP